MGNSKKSMLITSFRHARQSLNQSIPLQKAELHTGNLLSVTVDPITNWVGRQLEGQSIPQTIMDRLQSDHPKFPSGMLVLPSDDRRSPRILVPKYVQHDLVLQAHLDIHHQHYRKVHKILRPIYYWPAMDSAIENICK
jgi:hypothetical protein